jgi:hypothetical protein
MYDNRCMTVCMTKMVSVRLHEDVLQRIDTWATQNCCSRSEAIACLLADGLEAPASVALAPVAPPVLAVGARIEPEQTPDEAERTRRKAKKAARHRQLKEDARAALPAEVPEAFRRKMATRPLDHHPNCPCFRCRPPARA